MKPAEEVAELAEELAKLQQQHALVLGVGYMLRYSSAVQVKFCTYSLPVTKLAEGKVTQKKGKCFSFLYFRSNPFKNKLKGANCA